MKKQIKLNWQTIAFAAIATMVFMFAANYVAFAQGNYKAGDKIEVQWQGTWYKAEVVEMKNGSYKIHYDGYNSSSDEWVVPASMRRIGGTSPANNQTAPNASTTNQTDNQKADQPAQTTNLNKWGTRNPRSCENTKAPARGAPSAAVAKLYFICQTEGVSGGTLFLVENEKVEVVGGRPYSRNADLGVPDIDPKVLIYPLRGSFRKYVCHDYNIGRNCNVYESRKATGECYKTTFGDWRCSMNNGPIDNEDYRMGAAPPKAENPR